MQAVCSYLICATPRSGSTLLCEALSNTQMAGYPKEYFEALKATGTSRAPEEYFHDIADPEVLTLLKKCAVAYSPIPSFLEGYADYEHYLTSVLERGTTPNGVFGAKIMWGYIGDFLAYLDEIPRYRNMSPPDLLNMNFPNLHYISITRRDKVRQAVSFWKAIQTQEWKRSADCLGGRKCEIEVTYHFAAIDHLFHQIHAHEAAGNQFFATYNIQPLTIEYEVLADAYEEVARSILDFLGVGAPPGLLPGKRGMRQQADEVSEDWIQRYHMHKRIQEMEAYLRDPISAQFDTVGNVASPLRGSLLG